MRSIFAIIAAAVLLMASFAFLIEEELPENVRGLIGVPDDYHNAVLDLTVTLPNGTPADGFKVEVTNSMNPGYFDDGKTDGSGNLELVVNFMTLGICELKIYNTMAISVYYEMIEIWPDEVIDRSIEVGEPLEFNNHLHGVLRNISNNAPITDFRITVTGTDSYDNTISTFNITDQLGRYSIDLPNSSSSYRISMSSITDYDSFDVEIFLRKDAYDHPHDLYLKPRYGPSQPAHIRVRDIRTGEFQINGRLSIYGYDDEKDNSFIPATVSSTDEDSGWYNLSLNPGEYQVYWGQSPSYGIPSITFNNYFYVNDTELFHEIPVYIPEYLDLELEIWNETSPVPNVHAYWNSYDSLNENGIGCQGFAYSPGIIMMKVPADRKITLQITNPDYELKKLELDPRGFSSPVRINTTLKKYSYLPPTKANVTVRVVDDTTGIAIPYAGIYIYRISDRNIWGNPYTANETGILEHVVDMTARDILFTSFDFEAYSHIGDGKVTGLSLVEGPNPEIVIRVKRHKLDGTIIRSYAYIKDEAGVPVPDLLLLVQIQNGPYYSWIYTLTDHDGRVELIGPAGVYTLMAEGSMKHWRKYWSTGYPTFDVKESGSLGEITAYPTNPLETYWGIVKDAETLTPLKSVMVHSSSHKELDLTRNSDPPVDITLYSMNTGTDQGGFYRTHGMNDIRLQFSKSGYFNKKVEVQQGTRDVGLEDILLEPMTEFSCWVNGTLVNEEGIPISGQVEVMDRDHDDHMLHIVYTNDTGKFSFEMYPGNFTFSIYNATLSDHIDVTVGPDGIENLILRLIPRSDIWGYVLDWDEELLSDINVTLVDYDMNETAYWQLTDEFGEFSFEVVAGRYYLAIERTEMFDPFIGEMFETDGWDEIELMITLQNRSVADIAGRILGEEGPLSGGVPGAHVILFLEDAELQNVTANEMGDFRFIDVEYGENYVIEAHPPEEWIPVEDMRSGYAMNRSDNVTVSGVEIEVNIHLPFIVQEPPGWLEIVEYFPMGDNVTTDHDIFVVFSHPINISTFIEAFSIEPFIDVNFTLNDEGNVVIMTHPMYGSNTTYTVTVHGTVLSDQGWPLWNYTGVSWNFTTSYTASTWKIFDIEVHAGLGVEINVWALRDIPIFVVIDGVGSFEMEQHNPGQYFVAVDMENFTWATTYHYYFTDTEMGEDKAPGFSGTFTTFEEPVPQWEIRGHSFRAWEDGSIHIEAWNIPNTTVWVNITDVGWYQLVEEEEGVYRVIIPQEDLDWDTEYSMYFSDQEDGEDLAPDHSGTIRTVIEPKADDDDDDDTEERYVFSNFGIACMSCCAISLVLIFIILIVMLLTRRKKPKEGWDEE